MSVAVAAREKSLGRNGATDHQGLVSNGGKASKKGDAVSDRFSKSIKAESIIAIAVLFIASFLTITPPPSLSGHHNLEAGTPVHGQEHMEGVGVYTRWAAVMDANIEVEITSFYSGYNHFIVTIADEEGENIAQNISNVIMVFNNKGGLAQSCKI